MLRSYLSTLVLLSSLSSNAFSGVVNISEGIIVESEISNERTIQLFPDSDNESNDLMKTYYYLPKQLSLVEGISGEKDFGFAYSGMSDAIASFSLKAYKPRMILEENVHIKNYLKRVLNINEAEINLARVNISSLEVNLFPIENTGMRLPHKNDNIYNSLNFVLMLNEEGTMYFKDRIISSKLPLGEITVNFRAEEYGEALTDSRRFGLSLEQVPLCATSQEGCGFSW